MPVKSPDVLDRDGIGKHGAVAIELELIAERNGNECDRPAQTGANDQTSKAACASAGQLARHVLEFPRRLECRPCE